MTSEGQRVIVAGCRDVFDYDVVCWAIWNSGFRIAQVVSGCAPGVDSLGIKWAIERSLPIARYPADWGRHGKAAGPIRNQEMALNADALIAVWDGKSPGTRHMISVMRRARKPVFVAYLDDYVPCDIRGWTSGLPAPD